MDFYLGHLAECQSYFPEDIRSVATDAFLQQIQGGQWHR